MINYQSKKWLLLITLSSIVLALTSSSYYCQDEKGANDRKASGDAKKKFQAALAEWGKNLKETALKHLDEAKSALEDDAKEREKLLAAAKDKMKKERLSLTLKGGTKLIGVQLLKYSEDTFTVSFYGEGGGTGEIVLGWDILNQQSALSLIRLLYKDLGAKGRYEIGKFCLSRRFWKDAKTEFDLAAKLDPSLADRIPDLSKLIANEASFQGTAKPVGADMLRISYDFSDDDHLKDFKTQAQGVTSRINNRGIELGSKSNFVFSLKDAVFENEIEIDATMTISTTMPVQFYTFFSQLGKGYIFGLNTQNGNVIIKRNGQDGQDIIGKSSSVKVQPNRPYKLKIIAKGGNLKLYLDDVEVVSGNDSSYTSGGIMFGGSAGVLRFENLAIEGKVNPDWLKKSFAELEVLVRRAIIDDLAPKKKEKKEIDFSVSAELDIYKEIIPQEGIAAYMKGKDLYKQYILKDRSPATLQQSIQAFDECIKITMEYPASFFMRAICYLYIGNQKQFLDDVEQAIKLSPYFYDAYKIRGDILMSQMKYREAIRDYEKAIEIKPDFAEAYAARGYMQFVSEVYDKAIYDFNIATKLDPDDSTIKNMRKRAIHVINGPQWTTTYTKTTEHYIVKTDISQQRCDNYARKLEAIYKYYTESFNYTEKPKRKSKVLIFNTKEGYFTYAELIIDQRIENTLGFYQPMYKELLLFEDIDIAKTEQVLFHEGFHQFLDLLAPRPPQWYNEGAAEYFGATKVENDKITQTAMILEGRLANLKQLVMKGRYYKFDDIMKESQAQFYGPDAPYKYAQAWSMVHFFYQYQGGKYKSPITKYFEAIRDGKDIGACYNETFGKLNIKEIEDEWLKYVKGLK
ncbi:MAG: hypothetical protein A2W23_05915 [Planctomycetes bacterium RBG_16_43_13]|nr:MAG: hypothetical protein A2W23_05915 [Planctomycetes bacterium RBG_16_43_13]